MPSALISPALLGKPAHSLLAGAEDGDAPHACGAYSYAPPSDTSRPVIVLCHARTGSTLLSYLLNANPRLYCPAETNFGAALLGVARWAAEIAREPEASPDAQLLGTRQLAVIQGFVDALYSERLRAEKAARWCDKSLGTHVATELIGQLFPHAQFICLYRNFKDFAASALEACPFGLRNYGFDPYVQESPGNSVFSLARYWVDHVREITQFQDAHPDAAIGITYEALVQDFDATVSRLGTFLEAPWDANSVSNGSIFRQRYSTGFQDHKIASTTQIRAESVNRGWLLPVHMIAPPIVSSINELHAKLGYPPIDAPDIRDATQSSQLDDSRLPIFDDLVAGLLDRLAGFHEVCAESRSVVVRLDLTDIRTSLRIVPYEDAIEELSSEDWDLHITTSCEALRGVISGLDNVSSLVASGRLRSELRNPDSPDLGVVATSHHFWKAVSNPDYARNSVPILA